MLYGIFDTTILYYASTLYRPSTGINHSACGNNHSVERQINNSVYRTKHTTEECNCKHIAVETSAMASILEKGRLPCIKISEAGDEITLIVVDNTNDYVAISHVWSDGLGNVRQNSLPLCQLRRLHIFISEALGDHPLLWINTLCVPLVRKYRDLALILLGEVYERTSIVLVLDSDLLQVSAEQSSIEEKLLRICMSGWMWRLWTLKEGVLGGSRTLGIPSECGHLMKIAGIELCQVRRKINLVQIKDGKE
jgi:hypothetical protein